MSNYPNQGGYGQQYGQYQQQGGYQNTYNDPNAYPQAPVYGQQQGGYGAQEFGAPQRQNSFGPPQTGGFQHGVQGQTYGQYDASNPQGHADYYGGHQQPQYDQQQHQQQHQQQQYGQSDSFAANQAYQQQMASGTQPQPDISQHKFAAQSSDPNAPNYDPNAPAMTEQDRGLLGAIGGGFAGHHFGGKQGHGFLGTVGGALLGSFAEDFLKKKKNEHSSGNSSWGGGSKW